MHQDISYAGTNWRNHSESYLFLITYSDKEHGSVLRQGNVILG